MLMSQEFVRAEHQYRKEVLSGYYQKKSGAVTKGLAAAVLATILFAACGTVVADSGTPVVGQQTNVVSDNGPSWQPNTALLEEYLAQ